ncbi:MAG: type II toxin-antitoxin system VapC family toxin [Syntrophaceae bacterium]|nr:type II toxin-antitoxin system VapC family toxin [Syntrophaceae bacterium]
MKIILDTSVIVAVLTNEKHKQRLIELTKDTDLVAPSSLHWEVGNAFSAMLKKKRITIEQTFRALAAYAGIAIRFYEVSLKEVLSLCSKANLYAYDAYFIACALQLKSPLLSLNKDLLAAAAESGVSTIKVKP